MPWPPGLSLLSCVPVSSWTLYFKLFPRVDWLLVGQTSPLQGTVGIGCLRELRPCRVLFAWITSSRPRVDNSVDSSSSMRLSGSGKIFSLKLICLLSSGHVPEYLCPSLGVVTTYRSQIEDGEVLWPSRSGECCPIVMILNPTQTVTRRYNAACRMLCRRVERANISIVASAI